MTELKLICNRTHHATHRKAVKVVVHKNQHAKDNRRQLRSNFGLNMQFRPVSKRSCSPRLVHQGNHRTQHHQEEKNSHIPRIGHLLNHTVLENRIQEFRETPLTNKKSANQDSDKQRRIGFLGNKRKDNRDNRGHQRPKCSMKIRNNFSSLLHIFFL